MKQTFKSYVGIWAICLVLFNVIAFTVPSDLKNNFWAGYLFITVTFAGQLFCARTSFKAENAQRFFYNFPLISISFVGTPVMLFFGGITMAIPAIPVWVGVVLCSTVLAITAIAVINASVVSETVSEVDEKIKRNTIFIKTIVSNAEILAAKAQTEDAKKITKKVYEALRFSDPVSIEALSSIESQITVYFKKFEKAILENSESANDVGEDLLLLIADRNTKCKLLK